MRLRHITKSMTQLHLNLQNERGTVMYKYILKRLLMTVFVIIAAAWVIFTIMYFVPGDPATIMLGTNATYAEIQAKRQQLGLNDPYFIRLAKFMLSIFKLDFGVSWTYETPVFEQLLIRLPCTLIVSFSQMIFGIFHIRILLPHTGIWV